VQEGGLTIGSEGAAGIATGAVGEQDYPDATLFVVLVALIVGY